MGAPGTTSGEWAVHPHAAYVVPKAHVSRPIGGAEDAELDLATYAQEICALHWPDRHRTEAEVRANAHQIAASGALFDALEDAANTLRILLDVAEDISLVGTPMIAARLRKAEAVLKLARGESHE